MPRPETAGRPFCWSMAPTRAAPARARRIRFSDLDPATWPTPTYRPPPGPAPRPPHGRCRGSMLAGHTHAPYGRSADRAPDAATSATPPRRPGHSEDRSFRPTPGDARGRSRLERGTGGQASSRWEAGGAGRHVESRRPPAGSRRVRCAPAMWSQRTDAQVITRTCRHQSRVPAEMLPGGREGVTWVSTKGLTPPSPLRMAWSGGMFDRDRRGSSARTDHRCGTRDRPAAGARDGHVRRGGVAPARPRRPGGVPRRPAVAPPGHRSSAARRPGRPGRGGGAPPGPGVAGEPVPPGGQERVVHRRRPGRHRPARRHVHPCVRRVCVRAQRGPGPHTRPDPRAERAPRERTRLVSARPPGLLPPSRQQPVAPGQCAHVPQLVLARGNSAGSSSCGRST